MPTALLAVLSTAENAPINPDDASPGLWGFFFFVALGVATVVLIKFMNRSVSRIDPSLPGDVKSTGFGRRE